MTLTIALQNLVHDRLRFAVTLVGVTFSVVLIGAQIGIFIGFARTASALVDRNAADIWIMGRGTKNVDQAAPIAERWLYQALAVPGVLTAKLFVTNFAMWQKPAGGIEPVMLVGAEPDSGLGTPWNIVAGDPGLLKGPDAVFIDELYRDQLGIDHLGQTVEINGRRARVVGFTSGIRSFTLSPYVFTSLRSAQAYAGLRADETKYLLVKVAPGADVAAIRSMIAKRIPDVDVYTSRQFSRATQFYWMVTTGAGLALCAAALLGIAVGVVVVAQTLYATTVDHLKEFATLRAIGASSGYIHAVIVNQALISAIIGYAVGIAACYGIVRLADGSGLAILLPWQVALALAGVTALMCTGAGMISIRKVTRLNPALVFR